MDKKEFGNRIEARRKRIGLSRKDAIEMSGLAPSSWAAYERGEKTPPLDVAAKIADTLGVSLDWLAGGKVESIKTWGDVLRSICKIILALGGNAFPRNINLLVEEEDDGRYIYVEADKRIPEEAKNNGDDIEGFSVIFDNSPISDISESLGRLFVLFLNGDVEKEVFDMWVEKKASELDAEKVGEKDDAPQE